MSTRIRILLRNKRVLVGIIFLTVIAAGLWLFIVKPKGPVTRTENILCMNQLCVTTTEPFTSVEIPQCIDECGDFEETSREIHARDHRGVIYIGHGEGPGSESERNYCSSQFGREYKIIALEEVPRISGVKLVSYATFNWPESSKPYAYYQRILDEKTVNDCGVGAGKIITKDMPFVFDYKGDNYNLQYVYSDGFQTIEDATAHALTEEARIATQIIKSVRSK